jgi:hypothetical protein
VVIFWEFAVHDRVLAFVPRWGDCQDVWFVYIPQGAVVYWGHDVRHGGTSHAIWRAHPNMPKRANGTVWGVAVHWYVDAYLEDEKTSTGKPLAALNEMRVEKNVKGQPHCGASYETSNAFRAQQKRHKDTRGNMEKEFEVKFVNPGGGG